MVANCEKIWQEISNYLEGEVDANLRAAMEEHLRECGKCAVVLAGTRNVVRLYGDERMIEVPAGFSRRLEKRLARGAKPAAGGWAGWLVAAAAAVLVTGGWTLANSFTATPPVKSELAQAGLGVPPGLMVLISPGGKVFHVPGCSTIHEKDKVRLVEAREAIRQGYVPCVRCLHEYLKAGLDWSAVDVQAQGSAADVGEEIRAARR
jgi:hypothetical protein